MNKYAFKRYPKVKVAIDVAAVSMPTCSVLTQLRRRRFNGVYLRKSMFCYVFNFVRLKIQYQTSWMFANLQLHPC